MFNFDKINKVAEAPAFLPTKRITELEFDYKYKITKVSSIKTKYGQKIVITIQDEFNVYLPARLTGMLLENEQELKLLVQAAGENHLYFKYMGGPHNKCQFLSE